MTSLEIFLTAATTILLLVLLANRVSLRDLRKRQSQCRGALRTLDDILNSMRDMLHDDFNARLPGPQPYLDIEAALHNAIGNWAGKRVLEDTFMRSSGDFGGNGIYDFQIPKIWFEHDPELIFRGSEDDKFKKIDSLISLATDPDFDKELRHCWQSRTLRDIVQILAICHRARWRYLYRHNESDKALEQALKAPLSEMERCYAAADAVGQQSVQSVLRTAVDGSLSHQKSDDVPTCDPLDEAVEFITQRPHVFSLIRAAGIRLCAPDEVMDALRVRGGAHAQLAQTLVVR